MNRVIILGSPGSGKSTFATKLQKATSLPLIHLDFYYHQKKYDYYNDRDAWVARVKKLMEPRQWIVDGNYQSTIPMRCEQADTIILFDLPRWLCLYRVLKRAVHFKNKRRVDMPSEWTEKIDGYFLKFVWRFNKDQLPPIQEALAQNGNKEIIIFKESSEAHAYLQSLKKHKSN